MTRFNKPVCKMIARDDAFFKEQTAFLFTKANAQKVQFLFVTRKLLRSLTKGFQNLIQPKPPKKFF